VHHRVMLLRHRNLCSRVAPVEEALYSWSSPAVLPTLKKTSNAAHAKRWWTATMDCKRQRSGQRLERDRIRDLRRGDAAARRVST
jgi:hypothetical protein